jgi:hypothetical protein
VPFAAVETNRLDVAVDALTSGQVWTSLVLGAIAIAVSVRLRPTAAPVGLATSLAALAAWRLGSLAIPAWGAVGLLAVGVLAEGLGRRARDRPRAVLLVPAIAAAGMWACVPDTERALVAAGVLAGSVLAVGLARPPGGVMSVAIAGAGVLALVGLMDGERAGAEAGAATIVVLVLLVVAPPATQGLLTLGACGVATALASRVVGVEADAGSARLLGGVVAVGLLAMRAAEAVLPRQGASRPSSSIHRGATAAIENRS